MHVGAYGNASRRFFVIMPSHSTHVPNVFCRIRASASSTRWRVSSSFSMSVSVNSCSNASEPMSAIWTGIVDECPLGSSVFVPSAASAIVLTSPRSRLLSCSRTLRYARISATFMVVHSLSLCRAIDLPLASGPTRAAAGRAKEASGRRREGATTASTASDRHARNQLLCRCAERCV